METFNLGQLTKEMVASRLRELEDPCAVAAKILEDALTAALRTAKEFGPEQKAMVSEACHGAMIGILLRHQDLARGAVQALRAVCAATQTLCLDPTEVMTLAIIGIARIANVASGQQLHDIVYALEEEFMGAGEAFRELCRTPDSPKIVGP